MNKVQVLLDKIKSKQGTEAGRFNTSHMTEDYYAVKVTGHEFSVILTEDGWYIMEEKE